MFTKINSVFFSNDHKKEHFRALDGLRGLAVLFVLLSHASNYEIFIHEYLNFSRLGKLGVYLFFVLSAYLLDRQIALVFLKKKSSKLYWKNYFLRRFLRIYPLFFIALIIHFVVTVFFFPTVIDGVKDIFEHVLMLKGESIFWSIPVEFKYYFISPVLMWFLNRYFNWELKKVVAIIIGLGLVSVIVASLIELKNVSTFRYLSIFLIGTLLSIVELILSKSDFWIKRSRLFEYLGWICIITIILTIPFYSEMLFGFSINFNKPVFYVPYSAFWGGILLAAKYGNGLISRFLEIKLLRFVGVISFSAYLFHMPILEFVRISNFIIPELKFYVFLILTLILSGISFILIEKPLSGIRIQQDKALYPSTRRTVN